MNASVRHINRFAAAICLMAGLGGSAMLLTPSLSAKSSDIEMAEETDSIPVQATAAEAVAEETAATQAPIKKVLFIGDSMTGWMAERLNAYGDKNNFEVATVVWDGSTIGKWAKSPRLEEIIKEQAPDAIFVSLGMNELFEQRPETRLKDSIDKIKDTFGDVPFLWIGPPSWPGHTEGEAFDTWIAGELGPANYFSSFDLTLPRQSSSNPHPSRKGIEEWIDDVAVWIPAHTSLNFQTLDAPEKGKVSRGKTFIYKRMKETL